MKKLSSELLVGKETGIERRVLTRAFSHLSENKEKEKEVKIVDLAKGEGEKWEWVKSIRGGFYFLSTFTTQFEWICVHLDIGCRRSLERRSWKLPYAPESRVFTTLVIERRDERTLCRTTASQRTNRC
ncbi:hypothetical protein KQX54_003674 [Cotesia glomerata]|uniref:Uncharacterized protein n=1 Tax=Cotesia glomerata TaxID=32391 RepID=A0AAV7HWQ1_COTGL|nr:hypothetical protein KQX54_003674 [Cotesia glomerata]